MILIDDDMSRMTEQELKRLSRIADPQRQEEALRYRHLHGQYCCLRSWEMLQELLQRMGIDHMGEWRYNEYGKPYLTSGPFFSVFLPIILAHAILCPLTSLPPKSPTCRTN